MKLLIIDDDLDLVALMKSSLGKEFQILEEGRGANAFERVLTEKPDFIMLDLHMPNVDGFEVLEQIMSNPKTNSIPVICISADDSAETRQRAAQIGSIGFIKKPFDRKNLLADLKSTLGNINSILTSNDGYRTLYLCHNDGERSQLMAEKVHALLNHHKKVILVSWKNGEDFVKENSHFADGINKQNLIYFQIKPSLIGKFPYLQDLSIVLEDLSSMVNAPLKDYVLVFDNPIILFSMRETELVLSKMFSFYEVLTENFREMAFFLTKSRDPYMNQVLEQMTKVFLGIK